MAMSNDHSGVPASGTSPSRGLEVISAEIAQCQKNYETSFLTIGQLLLEAKDQVGKHGKWLKWLRNNVDFSICTAQRLMRVAEWMKENEALEPHLDFTKAYILCKLTKEELKAFLEGKHIEDMSKLKLQKEVRDFLQKKAGDASTDSGSGNVTTEDKLRQWSARIRNDVTELVDLIKEDPGEYEEIVTALRDFINQKLSPGAN